MFITTTELTVVCTPDRLIFNIILSSDSDADIL